MVGMVFPPGWQIYKKYPNVPGPQNRTEHILRIEMVRFSPSAASGHLVEPAADGDRPPLVLRDVTRAA